MSEDILSNTAIFSVSRADITLAGARHVIAAAHDEADRKGLSISVAVVDRGGELVAFERNDKAPLVS